ncbi:type II CRISPR-associated endonuclease Cas1 [Vibrio sp. DNB22_19_2]
MSHNQVIIIEKPTFIHVKESCLLFEQQRKVVARVLPEDIDCLILHYTSTITASALAALAKSRATVTLLDEQQLPLAHWQPPKANFKSKQRLRNLLALADTPLAERLWQRIVAAKIRSQAETIKRFEAKAANTLYAASKKVELGDSTNLEAYTARLYWRSLFGEKFRRQKRGSNDPVNQHLNFGYGIIRSLIAKWLSGRGIAVELGIHHNNQDNPMCLVDDFIEPFRFIVDRAVAEQTELCNQEISPNSKKALLTSIYQPISINDQQFRLASAVDTCVSSFGRILDKPSKAAASWLILPYT